MSEENKDNKPAAGAAKKAASTGAKWEKITDTAPAIQALVNLRDDQEREAIGRRRPKGFSARMKNGAVRPLDFVPTEYQGIST